MYINKINGTAKCSKCGIRSNKLYELCNADFLIGSGVILCCDCLVDALNNNYIIIEKEDEDDEEV